MAIKVYACLGNHDRSNGETPMAEILYSAKSTTWRMPAGSYTYTAGPAQFWAIDGTEMTAAQLEWLRLSLEKSSARWKIVYGHYPLYSASAGPTRDGHIYAMLFPILDGCHVALTARTHHCIELTTK